MVRESKREKERKRKIQRRSAIMGFIAALLVLIMLCILLVKNGDALRQKNKELESQIDEVESQIEEETQRASDLEEYQEYIQSKKFVEEIAKNKFGLIYPNEIIFKANE